MSPLKKLLPLLLILLAACTLPAPQTPTTSPDTPSTSETPAVTEPAPTGETIPGVALVDSVEVAIAESFPVQVFATVRGNLPDGCTTIDQIIPARDGNNFTVSITTLRPADLACTQALVPFEETFALDVNGLPAGDYTVIVNTTATSTFTLATDNVSPTEPAGEPTPPVSDNVTIEGTVWHDLCSVAGGEGGEPAVPSEGCVQNADGSYQANGIFEADEPGLNGVTVFLAQDVCPATDFPTNPIATTTTLADGKYSFTSLPEGVYCVFVDLNDANKNILIPGWWTYPIPDSGKNTVQADASQTLDGINFGWDYQFLPEPDQAACTDDATFVEDVTVPDDTTFPANHSFIKTWRLKNSGTCTWDSSYAVVFDSGEQMAGTSPTPLPQVVAPGETVDISLSLTTPGSSGTYQSDWLLQNGKGVKFGVGPKADETFYLRIIVTESLSDLNLGAATWTDSFANSSYWYLLNSGNVKWEVKNDALQMTVTNAGGNEEWGISNRPDINDFYLQATFRTGDECSGLDRYGFLFRAPDPNKGYVLDISCDGRYRLYKWDGQTYSAIQEWTADANILSGSDKTNKIGIWAKSDTLRVYINGVKVAEFTDNTFKKGGFGLLLGSAITNNLKVFVEEIAYWILE